MCDCQRPFAMKQVCFISAFCATVSALDCRRTLPNSSLLAIEKKSVKLDDKVRERTIPAIVWKPSAVSGPFPFVALNHGAGMSADSAIEGGYAYIGEALAQRGYVVAAWDEYAMVGTQLDYILDSAAIRDTMFNASDDSSHEFHGLLCDRAVGVGHSLGGGAEFVAADEEVMRTCGGSTPCNGGYTANFQGLATLSGGFKWDMEGVPDPYETARRLSIPALFVSGTRDCMVKPLEENYPFFRNMTHSSCRIFANVTGADHCQWAGLSSVAQAACVELEKVAMQCGPTLSAKEQQAVALKYILPFFDFVTQGDSSSLGTLLSQLDADDAQGAVLFESNGCSGDALI